MGRLLLNYHHRRSSFIIFLVYATSLIVSFTNASSSFPATIQSVDNSFWQTDESSSDWEWDEEDDDRGSSDGSTLSEEEMDSSATDFSSENTTATVTATRRLHQQNKNKPLETLEKLQQMLDETDYMTTTSSSSLQPSSSSTNSLHEHKNKDEKQLWTSKDRSKYKKQQKRTIKQHRLETIRTTTQPGVETKPNLQQGSNPPPPPHLYSSTTNSSPPPPNSAELSSDASELSETEGDGLGYTLPNLPVYLSDDEAEEEDESTITNAVPSSTASPSRRTQATVIPPPQYPTIPPPPPPQYEGSPPYPSWTYGGYPYPPPQQVQPQQASQPYYPAWESPPPPRPYYYPRSYVPRIHTQRRQLPNTSQHQSQVPPPPSEPLTNAITPSTAAKREVVVVSTDTHPTMTYLGDNITFWQIINGGSKLFICVALVSVVSYSAVSPRKSLTMYQYNQRFYSILKLVALTSLPPLVILWNAVVDVPSKDKRRDTIWEAEQQLSKADNNEESTKLSHEDNRMKNKHKTTVPALINAFYVAFTWGYCIVFGLQVLAATLTRVALFSKWEPNVFQWTPEVPVLVIPWMLREFGYKPKRITLIVQDFVTSCLLCPIVEEYMKLLLLQTTTKLPKNFKWTKIRSEKKRILRAEPLQSTEHTQDVVNVNAYVSNMLAVTLGIKLADSIRRVCMYTKPYQASKAFYAFFRGIFPVRELCGITTALALARRDVLGQHMPMWKMLLPACVIHGMANFRGMKPVFKWNSATPWVEMQLSPPSIDLSSRSKKELMFLALPKLFWLIILARVLGYCVKNYYMINRQAVKRTTTYAGKHSAFSAELAATEMLKIQNKKDKK